MFWFLCTLYHNISKDSNSWLTNWIFLKWICFDFLAEWTLTWRQWCTVRVWRPVGRQSGSLSSSSTRSPRWPPRATDSSTLSPAPNRLGCSAGRRTVLKWRKLTFSISYISKMSKELNCLRVGSFWRIWYKLIDSHGSFVWHILLSNIYYCHRARTSCKVWCPSSKCIFCHESVFNVFC